MRINQVISLSQFIADQQSKHPEATGDLSKIFRDIKFAAKIVNRDVRKAGLVDHILGAQLVVLDLGSVVAEQGLSDLSNRCLAIIFQQNTKHHRLIDMRHAHCLGDVAGKFFCC